MVAAETMVMYWVEQGQGVALQHFAMRTCAVREQREFGAAFAKTEIERAERCHHVEPGREAFHFDERGARVNAEDESRRDDHHIQNRNVLEPARIRQINEEVDRKHARENGESIQPSGSVSATSKMPATHATPCEVVPRAGTIFLFRMLAVGFDVREIVKDVDRAGDEAEQREACHCPCERHELKQLLVEYQRKKTRSRFSSTGAGAWF